MPPKNRLKCLAPCAMCFHGLLHPPIPPSATVLGFWTAVTPQRGQEGAGWTQHEGDSWMGPSWPQTQVQELGGCVVKGCGRCWGTS